MAESAEFELKLIDAVSGPAKKMAEAITNVQRQSERTQAALNRVQVPSAASPSTRTSTTQTRDAERAAQAVRRLGVMQSSAAQMNQRMHDAGEKKRAADSAKQEAAARRMGLIQLQANKMNEKFDKSKKGNTFGGGFREKLGFRSVADYAKGAFIGDLAAGAVMGIVGAFATGAREAVGLVASGVKMAFHEGGKAENLRLSYKLLLGDQGGKDALADISGFAGKTKYDDDAIAEMMRPLFNAGLRGTGARSAFAASGDLEAAGLGSAQEFIADFTKIQLKGGVTEKLLVGMGVNIRDFKEALAESKDKAKQDQTFEKASTGKLDPQRIMNAIYSGIEKRQGGKLGTGTEAASRTMSARIGKIQDLPSQYLKKMSESPEWDTLSGKLGEILESLDPDSERGQQIMGKLFSMFDELVTWVDAVLTPENLDTFVSSMKLALDAVRAIAGGIADIMNVIAHPGDHIWDIIKAPITLANAEVSAGADLGARLFGTPSVPDEMRTGTASNDNSVKGGNVNIYGPTNLQLPEGADPKQSADAFYAHLERAKKQGGG